MTLNPKVYDTIKYLALIGLPAIATFVAGMGAIWEWDNTDKVVKSIIAFSTLLGALTVLNKVRWDNSDARFDGTMTVEVTPPGEVNEIRHLDVDDPTIDAVTNKGEILMKVVEKTD